VRCPLAVLALIGAAAIAQAQSTTDTRLLSQPAVSATRVAFSGNYDGNTDVYVIPATGGVPKRPTYPDKTKKP
jgi:Tol biopolymer transport system component